MRGDACANMTAGARNSIAPLFAVVLGASAVILALLVCVLWLSLRSADPGDPDAAYALVNYREVLGEPFTWRVLANTLQFALVALAVAMLFGLPAAWLFARTDLAGKALLSTLMTIGLLIPGFATAMGWLFLLHPRIGLVNGWLMAHLGLAEPPFNIASIAGMGFVQGLDLAPVAFIMTAAVFRAMDPALEECAQTCGAGRLAVARRVTLRLAWPGILAAGIYIVMIGFSAFDVPAIIGWSNRIFTFSTYLLLQVNPGEGLPQYGRAAALSAVIMVLGLALSFWYGRMQAQGHRYQVVTGKGYRPRIVRLGRAGLIAWLLLGIYFALSKLLPILVLVWASLLPYFQLPSLDALDQLSLLQFRSLPWDLVREGLANTALLSVLTPSLTLVLAIAFSWIVLRSRIAGRGLFDVIAFLPHAVPNMVFGLGALLLALYVVGAVAPLFGTLWLLLLVFCVARLSYGTRMTNASLIQIHRELEEAAAMAGASTARTLTRVLLPLMAPGLVYAWLWIALLTFRELTLAVLLTTRANITLPVVVWSLWLSGQIGRGAALTLLMLALLVPFIALYWLIAGRRMAQ
jgi:iron(III) transport system permease protein